ncbi:MAG: histidinol-phosphate transaminase [Eubacteriales bacterium]|jgi:histidinol-phosphate aminotransferase
MIDSLVRKTIQSFTNYSPPSFEGKVILNANENAIDIFHERFLNQFQKKLQQLSLNRYPDSDSNALRELFAAYIGAAKEEIIVGVGCDEILRNILDAFVEKGDIVLGLEPTFSMYETLTTIVDGTYCAIACDEDFVPDVKKIVYTANELQAKMLFLCSPNNPTGYTFDASQLRTILENTSCLVVLDEVYADFASGTYSNLYREYPRLIVLRTLSKAFSLAGIRVGFGIARAETLQYLYRVKVPYNLNTLSQAAAEVVLSNPDIIHAYTAQTVKRREALYKELKQFLQLKVYPTQANFILIQTNVYETIKACAHKHGIALKYFSSDVLQNHIRITVGSEKENAALLSMLKEALYS